MILHHNIGYTIFQETEQFSRALPKSAQRITPEKIWTNFKTHFQEATTKTFNLTLQQQQKQALLHNMPNPLQNELPHKSNLHYKPSKHIVYNSLKMYSSFNCCCRQLNSRIYHSYIQSTCYRNKCRLCKQSWYNHTLDATINVVGEMDPTTIII